MVGVCRVEKQRVELKLPKVLRDALDAYCNTLINRPSRNFIIAEACREYLRNRGIEVHTTDDNDALDT